MTTQWRGTRRTCDDCGSQRLMEVTYFDSPTAAPSRRFLYCSACKRTTDLPVVAADKEMT